MLRPIFLAFSIFQADLLGGYFSMSGPTLCNNGVCARENLHAGLVACRLHAFLVRCVVGIPRRRRYTSSGYERRYPTVTMILVKRRTIVNSAKKNKAISS